MSTEPNEPLAAGWPIEPAPEEDIDLDAAAEDARAVQLQPGPDDKVTPVETGDVTPEKS